jgi:hypothetical protein
MKKLRTCILITLLFNTHAHAVIWYVTESGAGAMDGTNWANAYPGTSLQTAINASGTGDEIWVACGTYRTTSGADRSISFSMKNGVAIYGSFIGTETNLGQRAFSCGPCSILSGEIGSASLTDNSYQVIKNQGLNSTAVIDGFTITHGYDERVATLTEGLGGGILNIGSGSGGICSPTIRNCVITANQSTYGAGIFNDGFNGGNASPQIFHCIITGNHALDGGGGIDNFGLSGNASPLIVNCLIISNTAENAAGGIYCWGGNNGNASPVIQHTTIAGNSVVNASAGRGGGIIADRSNGGAGAGGGSGTVNISVTNSIIWGNQSFLGPQFYTYENGNITATYSNVDTSLQFAPHVLQGAMITNLFTDPLFMNTAVAIGSDVCWMTLDDGYQLQSLSSCINAGDSAAAPLLDLAFNDRIMGTNVDMGAYEYVPSSMSNELFEPTGLFQIFPNPVMNELYIQADEPGGYILQDISGYKVSEINLGTSAPYFINTSGLPTGIYFLKNIKTGTFKKIIKL